MAPWSQRVRLGGAVVRGGLKMQDLNLKDQMTGHEIAGPLKRDWKLEDKLPKASTECNSWVIPTS